MTKNIENSATDRLTNKTFKEVVQDYSYSLKKGDIVAGNIISKEKQGFLINVGSTSYAYLPDNETVDSKQTITNRKKSDVQEFVIIKVTHNQRIIVSIKKLQNIQSWERIKQLHEDDVTVFGKISKKNKGGILVDVEGITGFVPNSHSKRSEEIKNKVTLPLKFLEINENSGYLLLSYKRVILQMYNANFSVGKVVNGIVTNIKSYGVFVDIGNASGLLHISEISNKHINNLDEIFKIGSKIVVSIIHLDTKQGRISLSTKFLN